jgi:GrxC family glutaredoxin
MAQVRIYTLVGCGYCSRAKALLSEYGVDFVEIDVTEDPPMRSWLRMTTGRNTLPQTFIDGKSVGGYSDLEDLDKTGQLARLLHRTRTPLR